MLPYDNILKLLQAQGLFGQFGQAPGGMPGGQMPPTNTFSGFATPQGGMFGLGPMSQMAQQLGRGQRGQGSPFFNMSPPPQAGGRMQIPQPIGWPSGPGGLLGGAR